MRKDVIPPLTATALLGFLLLLLGCQGPVQYERVPEPRHAIQESLLPCPHCGGQGLLECEVCRANGGWSCPTCNGFGLTRCPDCKLVLIHTDASPEPNLYYQDKTFGGSQTGMEAFEANVYADLHLHGIDRRMDHFLSSSLFSGKRCKTCNSRGVIHCPDCDRGVRTCPKCKGRLFNICPLCRGSGFVPSLTGEKIRHRGRIIRKRRR
jgi:predicted RNA-binding Zn-ribbon protein involved in translation (DUF1610 family)